MTERVVVTGLGTINPISDNVSDFWDNLVSLKNGINKISHFYPKSSFSYDFEKKKVFT